jgi:O-6-methylguanine DNA methyltransferase
VISKTENPRIKLPVKTADGTFIANYSEKGLAGLQFPEDKASREPDETEKSSAKVQGWHRLTVSAVEQTLAGKATRKLPPLDLDSGTDFQRQVWSALQKIEAGKTRSYLEIAKLIGNPRAVRAVGGACGANPIPVLIPCHRVLAANHKIGGFSGGLDWKRTLLAREGVKLR